MSEEPRYAIMEWCLPKPSDEPRINAAEDLFPIGVWDVPNDLLVCVCPDEEVGQRIASALAAADVLENEQ